MFLLCMLLLPLVTLCQNSFRLKVIDKESKENIKGALVYIEELPVPDKETDINGLVFYKNLPDDRKVRINVRKQGYIATKVEVLATEKSLPDNNLIIELIKEPSENAKIVIWGEVTDFNGRDLENATVEISYIGNTVKTQTDYSGNYKFSVDRKLFKSSKFYSIEVSHEVCNKRRFDEIIPEAYHIKKNITLNCNISELKKNSIKELKYSAQDLVGLWVCDNDEFGKKVTIAWSMYADGRTYYEFYNSLSKEMTGKITGGTWQYADGIIYEILGNGQKAQGRIEWINKNYFILTILENGMPVAKNIKRHYIKLR